MSKACEFFFGIIKKIIKVILAVVILFFLAYIMDFTPVVIINILGASLFIGLIYLYYFSKSGFPKNIKNLTTNNLILFFIILFSLAAFYRRLYPWLGNSIIVLVLIGLIYKKRFKPISKYEDINDRAGWYKFFRGRQKAIDIYNRSLLLENLSSLEKGDILIEIGILHIKSEQWEEAKLCFNKVLHIENINEEQHVIFNYRIAQIYFKGKKFNEACEGYRIVYDYMMNNNIKDSIPIVKEILRAYIYNNDRQGAIELYNSLIDKKLIMKNKKVEKLLEGSNFYEFTR